MNSLMHTVVVLLSSNKILLSFLRLKSNTLNMKLLVTTIEELESLKTYWVTLIYKLITSGRKASQSTILFCYH